MEIKKGIIIGTIVGFSLSFFIPFIFMLVAQRLAGGFTSLFGESWIYYATIVPFTLTFAILGFYNITNILD